MCGIAGGLFHFDRDVGDLLINMGSSLAHRGPDAFGAWSEDGIFLTHNRLSILDLTSAANQPFHSFDGRYVVVYNGEIYNYRELRNELAGVGVRFLTSSDTEVVVEAIAYWGLAAIPKFNGMFAFACWDRVEQKLMLARDRFGIKPLYIARRAEGFFFGSEIKALLAVRPFEGRICVQGLAEYMWFGNALGANTLYRNVIKVLPGEIHIISRSTETVERYWDPSQVKDSDEHSVDAARHVRHLLEAAVSRQLVSDVPVGIFLSGGVDSSAITAFAAKNSATRISSYSVEFDFALAESELSKASLVAKHFGTAHHEIRIQAKGLQATLEALIRAHDQPFGDAANIPLYLLTRELAGSVKVVLQGDGGDEIFGGYRRYQTLGHLDAWRLLARIAGPLISTLPRRPLSDRARRYCNALLPECRAHVMALLLTVEDAAMPPYWMFSQEFRKVLEATNPFLRYENMERLVLNRDAVQAMLYVDASIILPDIFLEKVDRATMANSMEVRVPFLDNELVDFALGLSSRVKLAGGELKGLLKRALVNVVPREILDAPKTGFGVPYEAWLRGPLKDHLRSTLLDPQNKIAPILDMRIVAEIVDQHVAGTRDHGFLLWKLMELSMWLTEYDVAYS